MAENFTTVETTTPGVDVEATRSVAIIGPQRGQANVEASGLDSPGRLMIASPPTLHIEETPTHDEQPSQRVQPGNFYNPPTAPIAIPGPSRAAVGMPPPLLPSFPTAFPTSWPTLQTRNEERLTNREVEVISGLAEAARRRRGSVVIDDQNYNLTTERVVINQQNYDLTTAFPQPQNPEGWTTPSFSVAASAATSSVGNQVGYTMERINGSETGPGGLQFRFRRESAPLSSSDNDDRTLATTETKDNAVNSLGKLVRDLPKRIKSPFKKKRGRKNHRPTTLERPHLDEEARVRERNKYRGPSAAAGQLDDGRHVTVATRTVEAPRSVLADCAGQSPYQEQQALPGWRKNEVPPTAFRHPEPKVYKQKIARVIETSNPFRVNIEIGLHNRGSPRHWRRVREPSFNNDTLDSLKYYFQQVCAGIVSEYLHHEDIPYSNVGQIRAQLNRAWEQLRLKINAEETALGPLRGPNGREMSDLAKQWKTTLTGIYLRCQQQYTSIKILLGEDYYNVNPFFPPVVHM